MADSTRDTPAKTSVSCHDIFARHIETAPAVGEGWPDWSYFTGRAPTSCQNCQTIWRAPPCLNQLGLGARPWIGDAPLLRDRAAASTPQKYLFGGSPCPWASPPNARR